MGQTYYFLNYSKNNRLEEKCPGRSCGEEFIPHKGGAQCKVSKCRYKQREEKHRTATPLMVNACLPKFKANVYTPNAGEGAEIKEEGFDNWGWSYDYSKSIYIPWYTLRSKKEFFDTVAHESGHILAYEERFISDEKKIIKEFYRIVDEYNEMAPLELDSQVGRNYDTLLNNYYQKHKKIIDDYTDNPWKERMGREKDDPGRWDHGARSFYPAYEKCFKRLLSAYAVYNYKNSSQPRPFDEVRDYKPKQSK